MCEPLLLVTSQSVIHQPSSSRKKINTFWSTLSSINHLSLETKRTLPFKICKHSKYNQPSAWPDQLTRYISCFQCIEERFFIPYRSHHIPFIPQTSIKIGKITGSCPFRCNCFRARAICDPNSTFFLLSSGSATLLMSAFTPIKSQT